MKKLCAALAATVVLMTAAGCGGGGRPSADEVSKAYQKGTDVGGEKEFKLPKAQADCVAKVLVDSKVSDEGLRAIADLDTKYKASQKDTDAIKAVSDDVAKCVTAK